MKNVIQEWRNRWVPAASAEIAAALALALSILCEVGIFLKLPIFLLWSIFAVHRLYEGFHKYHTGLLSSLYASIAWFSILSFGALLLYGARAVTPQSVSLLVTAVSVAIYCVTPRAGLSSLKELKLPVSIDLPVTVVAASNMAIILMGLFARTAEPLITPWFLYTPLAFILYAVASVILIYYRLSYTRYEWLSLVALHIFTSVSVSGLVYGIGFGFDPFIHRAAEMALIDNGYIDPFRMLYSGQYALIGFMHFASGISVRFLDIWFVPFVTTIMLSLGVYAGLREGWRMPEGVARLGWASTLIIPYMLLTFSVPFTFSYAQYILLPFLLPFFKNGTHLSKVVLVSFFFLGVFFHPLLLVPAFFLIATFLTMEWQRWRRWVSWTGLVICFTLALPILLVAYQISQGSLVYLASIGDTRQFMSLFVNVFGVWDGRVNWFYNVIYLWRYWAPIAIGVLGVSGVWIWRKEYGKKEAFVYTVYVMILFVNMYLVSTLFVFDNIIAHEQKEFALRLLQAAYASGALGVVMWLHRILQVPSSWIRILATGALGAFLTMSWYFSYPQYNAKFAFTSPSVSAYDIEYVRAIEEYAAGKPHLVLSNQMMSAAALQEIGFRDYIWLDGESVLWYAIPTGGALYEYYLQILFQGNVDGINELAERTEVEYVFVVAHSYWILNPQTKALLEQKAHDMISLNEKIKVYVFKYED